MALAETGGRRRQFIYISFIHGVTKVIKVEAASGCSGTKYR